MSDNDNDNYDDDNDVIDSTTSLSLRQKLLSAQILDEEIGYDENDTNTTTNNENDDITTAATTELEHDIRLNISTLQEMDDVIANLKRWHTNNTTTSSTIDNTTNDNDDTITTIYNFDNDRGPETNDDDDDDDDVTSNTYNYIDNISNSSSSSSISISDSITSVFLNKYCRRQTKERDISPEKMLEKLESLRRLMASTPRDPIAANILTHPITGINQSDDDNNALKKQLEKELEDLENASSWSQVHAISGEGLELEMDLRSLEANIRDYTDDLDEICRKMK